MDSVYVRHLSEGDWRLFRSIRLDALADALGTDHPEFRRESEFTGVRWRRRLREHAQFAVFIGARAVGLVGGQPQDADTVYLYSLWLEPAARGLGLATLLVDAVVRWARQHDAHTVRLRVEIANTTARGVYESLGFAVAPDNPRPHDELAMTMTVS